MSAVVRCHYFFPTIGVLTSQVAIFFPGPKHPTTPRLTSWLVVAVVFVLCPSLSSEHLIGVQTVRTVLDSAVTTRKMDSSFELALHFQCEESPKKPLLIRSNGHDTEHLNPKALR